MGRWCHPTCACMNIFMLVGCVTSWLLYLEYRCVVHARLVFVFHARWLNALSSDIASRSGNTQAQSNQNIKQAFGDDAMDKRVAQLIQTCHAQAGHPQAEVWISIGRLHSILMENLYMWRVTVKFNPIVLIEQQNQLHMENCVVFRLGKTLEVTCCWVWTLSSEWCIILDQQSLVQYLCLMGSVILHENENTMSAHYMSIL